MFFLPAVGILASAPSGGPEDPLTTAWAAAVVTAGGAVSPGRRSLVDTMLTGLRADGVIAKLDRLWVFAAENAASALTDMIAASAATAVNSPTFTADVGYTLDGSNFKYVLSNYVAGGGHYVLNSAHHSIWDVTSSGSTSATASDADQSNIYTRFGDGNAYFRVNRDAGGAVAVANNRGFYIANRSASNAVEGYKDGTLVVSDTQTSLNISASAFYYGLAGGQTDQVAVASIGGSLTGPEAVTLDTHVRALMVAIGLPGA